MPALPMLTPTPLARFESNKRRLGELLAELMQAVTANDNDRAFQLWEAVEPAVSLHFELEERYLLPNLFASSEREARVLVQEQRHLRGRVADLKAEAGRGALRPDTVRDFVDVLRAHSRAQERRKAAWGDDGEGEPTSGRSGE